jgi:CheY-like chemotaxis protein
MKKLLLIEDNTEMRENVEELLQLNGYSVLTAANGKAGVEIAMREIPDLVICDILMPVLDGYGVLYLLSKNDTTSSIPFLFLTAKTDIADFQKAMGMGADDYIAKPFDDVDLLHVVAKRLMRSELIRTPFSRDEAGIRAFIQSAGEYINTNIGLEQVQTKIFTKNQLLFSEGDQPLYTYFLATGSAQSFLFNEGGDRFITNTHPAGTFIGYMAILEHTPHCDNAETREDASLVLIPENIFSQLLSFDYLVAKQFIRLLAGNDLEKQELITNLSYSSLRSRVADGIIKLKSREEPIHADSVQAFLSRKIKTGKENIIRVLSDLKMENLIDLRHGEITILEERKLAGVN